MLVAWLTLTLAQATEYVYKSNIPGDLPQEQASRDVQRALAPAYTAKAGGPWSGWPDELVTAVKAGKVDVGLAEVRAVESIAPGVGAVRLPYIVDGPEHAERLISSGLAATLDALTAPAGVRVLAAFDGTRTGLAGPTHVRSPSDLAGQSVGIVFEDPIVQPSFEALGGDVVITKTDRGTSAGCAFLLETPQHLTVQLAMGITQLERTHWTSDGMRWTPILLLANAAWYDALPASAREAIAGAREAAEARVSKEWPAADEKLLDSLVTRREMKPYTPTASERASLAAATAPVRERFAAAHPESAALLTAIERAR